MVHVFFAVAYYSSWSIQLKGVVYSTDASVFLQKKKFDFGVCGYVYKPETIFRIVSVYAYKKYKYYFISKVMFNHNPFKSNS